MLNMLIKAMFLSSSTEQYESIRTPNGGIPCCRVWRQFCLLQYVRNPSVLQHRELIGFRRSVTSSMPLGRPCGEPLFPYKLVWTEGHLRVVLQ